MRTMELKETTQVIPALKIEDQLISLARSHEKITFENPVGLVSESGIQAILYYLTSALELLDLPQYENPQMPPKNFWRVVFQEVGFDWVTKQGTWPKRFMKVAKNQWKLFPTCSDCPKPDIKELITQPIVSEVGSIASRNVEQCRKFIYDVTSCFNWKAGDFGDDGSCFWGTNKQAKDMLSDAHFLALRFYHAERPTEGIARCWIGWEPDTKTPVLFNGYGMELIRQVRVLATSMGVMYRKVLLQNNGSCGGMLYINGGNGFALGDTEVTSVDFDLSDPEKESTYECVHCGDALDEDDTFFVDDTCYCSDCHSELYTDCSHCGQTMARDDVYSPDCADNASYCSRCHDRLFGTCSCCDETGWMDDMAEVEDRFICSCCFESHYEKCDNCGKVVKKDDDGLKEWGESGEDLCEDCWTTIAEIKHMDILNFFRVAYAEALDGNYSSEEQDYLRQETNDLLDQANLDKWEDA